MYTHDVIQDEKKSGNDLISIAMDSFMKLFKKSDDNYPPVEPASGFTQTPNKPKRNKGELLKGFESSAIGDSRPVRHGIALVSLCSNLLRRHRTLNSNQITDFKGFFQ